MSKKNKNLREKGLGIVAEFKKFISRGSVLDMAVGVVMATAFNAIINGIVNAILMPLISMAVPGGFQGLVTVLNPHQALATAETTDVVYYWGVAYDASVVNVINWGTVIQAVVNFFIIALTLFVLLKTVKAIQAKSQQLKEAAKERYYQEHPEARPAAPEPAPKKPTQEELLTAILAELKKQNGEEKAE